MLSKDQIEAMTPGATLWLVGTRDLERGAPWQTQKDSKTRRLLAYGEWAAFRTEHEAHVWHAQRLAIWARAEASRLLTVARNAERRARTLAAKGVAK